MCLWKILQRKCQLSFYTSTRFQCDMSLLKSFNHKVNNGRLTNQQIWFLHIFSSFRGNFCTFSTTDCDQSDWAELEKGFKSQIQKAVAHNCSMQTRQACSPYYQILVGICFWFPLFQFFKQSVSWQRQIERHNRKRTNHANFPLLSRCFASWFNFWFSAINWKHFFTLCLLFCDQSDQSPFPALALFLGRGGGLAPPLRKTFGQNIKLRN